MVVRKMGTRPTVDVRVIARTTVARFIGSPAGHREHRTVRATLEAWFHNGH
jgi:hypothetical protein